MKKKKTPFMRAVMLDLGRVRENKSYYASLLPHLAEWGYDTVHLHLADDQGSALRFPRRPELASPGAYDAEEMREFIRAAKKLGLAVLPEIECLGHVRFITEHAKYRHLIEPGLGKSGFNAICPAHPETPSLFRDLLRDVADIFEHPVIHVGLDEVKFGECPRCRKKYGAKTEDWRRFAKHAAWVHAEVRKLGRRPAMWADHVQKPMDMQQSFKRDVLMFHWQYNPEYDSAKADNLLNAGFEVVACPATVCWLTRLAVSNVNLTNLRNCVARSLPQRKKGLVGLDNTVWCPWRYLPGAIDYGMAFAGHLMTVREEDPRFAEKFAARFYGLSSSRAVAAALRLAAECSPEKLLFARILRGGELGVPFNREDVRTAALMKVKAAETLKLLKAEKPKVRLNRERYDDLILTAEVVLAVYQYAAAGRKKSAVKGAKALFQRAERSWNRDRRPDDDLRFGDLRHHGIDSFLQTLKSLS